MMFCKKVTALVFFFFNPTKGEKNGPAGREIARKPNVGQSKVYSFTVNVSGPQGK